MTMNGVQDWMMSQYDIYKKAVHVDSHPAIRDRLLLNRSYSYVLALSSIYLIFILHLGPKMMKNLKPLNLTNFMIVYNLVLTFCSAYMGIEIALAAYYAGYGFQCKPISENLWDRPEDRRMVNVLYWYFFSKSVELLDTVFMVLRKKSNQITFLHVFHHMSMLNVWWWIEMFIPVGMTYFSAMCNSFIHIAMYGYYGLSLIPSLRKYLWWKRYLTQAQLIQFAAIFVHTSAAYCDGCPFPKWGVVFLWWYMVILIGLFSHFYFSSYLNRKTPQTTSETKSIPEGGDNSPNKTKRE